MKNWQLLDKKTDNSAWDFVDKDLNFRPYNKDKIHKISTNIINKCFDISNFYDEGFSKDLYNNLHHEVLGYFNVISNGNRIIALDWRHDCYSFDPNLPFEKDEFDEWLIPAFPNGDLLFFLAEDYRNGIFGDGYDFKIYLFGEDIIKAFENNPAKMLTKECGG